MMNIKTKEIWNTQQLKIIGNFTVFCTVDLFFKLWLTLSYFDILANLHYFAGY